MPVDESFSFTLGPQDGYQCLMDFAQGGVAAMLMDEPEPLGDGSHPNAARVLAAAVENCLSASPLYCLRRAWIDIQSMHTMVSGSLQRNDASRMRIGGIRGLIEPIVEDSQQPQMQRCLELFEDFCAVTQSVRAGIAVDVDVAVEPATGEQTT